MSESQTSHARAPRLRNVVFRRRLAVLLTLAVGIGISVFVFAVTRFVESDRFETEYAVRRHNVVQFLQKPSMTANFHRHRALLGQIADAIGGDSDFTREDFRSFRGAAQRSITQLETIMWIPRITSGERPRYEALARRDGIANFTIYVENDRGLWVAASDRRYYYPVYYLEPSEVGLIDLGYDLASNDLLRGAMRRACDTALPARAGEIPLSGDAGAGMEFWTFHPVYRPGAPTDTVAQRREHLVGFAAMRTFLPYSGSATEFHETMGGVNLLVWSGTEAHLAPPSVPALPPDSQDSLLHAPSERFARHHYHGTIRTSADDLQIMTTPREELVASLITYRSWAALGVGLILTVVMLSYVIRSLRHTSHIEQQVAERTTQLTEINKQLRHEIAERRQAEEEMRKAEEKYRSIFENATEGIFQSHPDGGYLSVNPALVRILGYDSAEDLMAHLSDYRRQLDVDPQRHDEFVARIKKYGRVSNFESQVYRKDGSKIWISVNAHVVHDENGDIAYVEGTVYDITERKQSEEELARLSAFPRDIPAPIFTCTWDGKLTYGNPAARFIQKDLALDDPAELLPGNFRDLLRASHTSRIELHDIEVDVKGRVFSWNFQPIANTNTFYLYGIEITSRKRAEEALAREHSLLSTLMDTLPDYIWVKDADSRFLMMNSSHLKKLGGQTLEDVAGKTDFDFYPVDAAQQFFADEQELIKTGRPILNKVEMVAGEGDEEEEWVLTSKVPLRDDQGRITGLIGISRDITEVKRAEQEKAKLEDQLRHRQKMEAVGTLAGGIAHDFNNLLAGIRGYADMLKMNGRSAEEVHKAAGIIEKAAERGAELTRQLLGYARKGKMQNVPVNMHDIIHEVVALSCRTIDKTIVINRRLDAEHSLVRGDPSQLQQVILNLVVNARDAMPEGGELSFASKVVDIGAEDHPRFPEAEPGRFLMFSVEDTGRGIPPEVRDRMFEPFFTTKEPGEGTGMGLAMVYGIVKNHGGFIKVYSEMGCGSSFHVYLPLAAEISDMARPAREAPQPSSGAGRIMVVDDEEVVREMTRDMLEMLGYEVVTCCDGMEAVEYYAEHHQEVDLAIIDMVMPRLGGRDCFLALREINPNVRAILSSGYSRDGAAQDILSEGMLGFAQKPYRMNYFSEIVANALR